MKKIFTWRKYHKWVGLVLSVFLLVFCVSGIILNHRSLFSGCDVNRVFLPKSYSIENYSNGIIKGTAALSDGKVVAYGCAGAWLTDKQGKIWQEYNEGFPKGADQRNIRNVIVGKDSKVWCVTNYAVYRHDGKQWESVAIDNNGERLADITFNGDSTQVVALSRNAIYIIGIGNKVVRKELQAPADFQPKETLFRTVWKLHSGELFGLVGRLVVDAIAVVLIILSLTGIYLFIVPYSIRRHKRKGDKEACRREAKSMAWNQRWHNKIGATTIILTLFLTFSGTCLRPPFMIPLVMVKTSPMMSHDNPLYDKLRAIRWDKAENSWLLSTSEGFMRVDAQFKGKPTLLKAAPSISPMGVNVFEQQADSTWLVGSFSGMYRWNPASQEILDFTTGKPAAKRSMMSVSDLVSGYSKDFTTGKDTSLGGIIFDYSKGASAGMPEMPKALAASPMSLWNVALELHVGRCYSPFLGPISNMFVFLWGTLTTLIALSGYIVYRRQRKHKKK